MMKDLESEVLTALTALTRGTPRRRSVWKGTPSAPSSSGGEKNVHAAWIAEMVMWIGYLQWHFRNAGDAKSTEPILRNFNRILHTDALLTWTGEELVRDGDVRIARWPSAANRIGRVRFLTVVEEIVSDGETPEIVFHEQRGDIALDLSIGLSISEAQSVKANALLCSPGVNLHGPGFMVSPEKAEHPWPACCWKNCAAKAGRYSLLNWRAVSMVGSAVARRTGSSRPWPSWRWRGRFSGRTTVGSHRGVTDLT